MVKKASNKKDKSNKKDNPKEVLKKSLALDVLKRPYLSEKATQLAQEGKYVFEVSSQANKIQVKEAIEAVYGVKVDKVWIVKLPPKRKRFGRFEGKKPGVKKAIVKLKEGYHIEILPT